MSERQAFNPWMEGESDCGTETNTRQYRVNLREIE